MMGLMASDETRTETRAQTRAETRAQTGAHVRAETGGAARAEGGVREVPAETATTRAWTTRLLVLGIVLAALNLRPAITSLGALLEEVRDGLGMSGSVAGLLTSVPPLCFAVFGVTAPRLARRFGPGAVVCAGMVAITAGLVIRPYAGGTGGFLAASALALMGIAVSNVLMPVIVKRYFPDRVGSMTGLYSMALAFGTSVAAAATVPGDGRAGRRLAARSRGLGRAAGAGRPAVARLRTGPRRSRRRRRRRRGRRAGTGGRGAGRGQAPALRITRSSTAWALAVFFGLQATAAYITMGWMAQIFRDAGVPAGQAGLLLAVIMVMGVPLAFVIPRVAGRLPRQGPIVLVLGVSGLPDTRASTSPRPPAPGPGRYWWASPTAPSRSRSPWSACGRARARAWPSCRPSRRAPAI
ncbi:hypothetical protein STENM223S_03816 [Streptomyces tendae]